MLNEYVRLAAGWVRLNCRNPVSPEGLRSSPGMTEIHESGPEGTKDSPLGARLREPFRYDLSGSIPLKLHPTGFPANPLAGVFSTGFPCGSNSTRGRECGVTLREGLRFRVNGLDGTPVIEFRTFRRNQA